MNLLKFFAKNIHGFRFLVFVFSKQQKSTPAGRGPPRDWRRSNATTSVLTNSSKSLTSRILKNVIMLLWATRARKNPIRLLLLRRLTWRVRIFHAFRRSSRRPITPLTSLSLARLKKYEKKLKKNGRVFQSNVVFCRVFSSKFRPKSVYFSKIKVEAEQLHAKYTELQASVEQMQRHGSNRDALEVLFKFWQKKIHKNIKFRFENVVSSSFSISFSFFKIQIYYIFHNNFVIKKI